MRDLVILFVHIIVTLARLVGPAGLRSVVTESVLIKQQILILNRSRQRAPNLRSSDRLVAGLCALFIRPARLIRSPKAGETSTLLNVRRTLRIESIAALLIKPQEDPSQLGPQERPHRSLCPKKAAHPT